MYPPLYIIQNGFTARKILCAPPINPSLFPQAPANHWSFYYLCGFAFSRCHIVGIIQYLAFLDWLLSLSNMPLRSLHVFLWPDSSFLFIAEYSSIVWMYHSLFIHLPVELVASSFGSYK